ncbi:ABC transporter permease [Rhodovastum atsumiense]|uniref:ABC transporter permease n=1 Tax=Rhodovastum atsumiense TaxID=504468 RepID=A0A5M6IPM9_9PROT|nr:ABC transporter permease [Rhodovastum atsumiense]KAA5610234.1 ABC transporter permease [Rhodovastum atsumiense]CAH2604146.1 ABC transporter permease [Rhodovastum atsumiense]
MDFVLIQFLTGLAGASSLFLVAAGLTVIFGVTRVVNFAHGSLFMLGAYIGFSILTRLPREPGWHVAGVLLAALAVAAIGVLLETGLLRRLYRAPELLQLLATFGVVLVVQELVLLAWGPNDLSLSRPRWLRGFVTIAGARFPLYDLILIGIGPLVLLGLWLLLGRTRWGVRVRAATEDREMVAALGVDQRLLFTTVFALGAGLAGLGGALALPDGSANLHMDLSVITDAFVVVVVGGMGSLPGAFLASLLIAELQAFGIVLLPKATLVLVFVVMAVVLAVRPHGLLGRAQAAARGETQALALIRPAGRALRWLGLAVLVAGMAAPFLVGPFALSVLTEAMIAVLFAASLHVIMGPGGMASFGHAAWFGIGAYAAALAATQLAWPMAAGLALAPVAAGVAALAFAAFVVRLSGVYLAMLTLAFAQIVWAASFQSEATGGDNGILGVWPAPWAADPAVFWWLTLALCAGGAVLLRRVLFSPFGYALRACRDSAARAEATGLWPAPLRMAAFALAGAAAGLAGALAAYSKGSVFPTMISIERSVDALVMVLLGGVQTMAGPVLGALAYTGLYDTLLLATDRWRLVLGLAIIALVLAFPQGIAGAAQRLGERDRA